MDAGSFESSYVVQVTALRKLDSILMFSGKCSKFSEHIFFSISLMYWFSVQHFHGQNTNETFN